MPLFLCNFGKNEPVWQCKNDNLAVTRENAAPGGVCADDGVAVVGTGAAAAGDGEHAAHSEGGGAGPGGGAALALALRGGVAGAVVAVGGATGGVGEGDHVEHAQHPPVPLPGLIR